MLPLNHAINSATLTPRNIITTSSVYRQLFATKQQQQQQQTQGRSKTTTTITTITTTSLFSVNTTSITSSSLSSSTSLTQPQQLSFDESYSAKTGIKTAALLGGM
jgi:predicted neuraminidase